MRDATLVVTGEFIDILRGPSGDEDRRDPRANLVMARALDLISDLLACRQNLRGLVYWAVGLGDPAWDAAAQPPAPDRRARTLLKETFRKRLEPGDLTYDPATHILSIHTLLAAGEATGDLREFGVFGGDAAGAPDTGYLFNTGRHAVIHKAPAQSLDRSLKLTLSGDAVLAGLLDTVGQLLSNRSAVSGVRVVAFGAGDPSWDQHPPGFDPQRKALQSELIRKPVDPAQDIELVPYQQAILVHAALEYREAPVTVREVGLFGGPLAAPVLLDHLAFAAIDHSVAGRLRMDVRLEVGVDAAIVVPDVTTKTLAAATAALAVVGLQVSRPREEERPGGNNTVLRQKPAANDKAVDGATVQLTMAVPVSVPAPRLIGLTVAQATPVLAALGLTVAPNPQTMESPQPADSILSQIPAASDLIRPGNAIVVIVAVPETTLVPDITGMRPGEAAVALSNNRLKLSATPFPTVQTKDGWGSIVSQSPAPATRIVVQSPVTPTLAAPPTVNVPNLVGALLATAAQSLTDAAAAVLKAGGKPSAPAGLAVGQITYVENATPAGTILNQTPAAGQPSILYGTVDIVVASPVTVLVPALTGLAEQAAITTLRNVGLLPGAVTRRIDPSPVATVLAQDPPSGSRIALGSLVAYTAASLIQVQVPALLTHSVDFAKEALAGSRLTLGTVTRVPTTAAPPGSITAQDQPAGKSVDINSVVNITIAGNTVQMPNLVGLTQPAAVQLLAGLGLTLAVGAPVETGQVVAGLIGGQTPAVNATAQVGSTVTVNLAIPPKVAVPNLVGKTTLDAQTLAAAAHFTFSVTGQAESDLTPGLVAAQSPPAQQPAPFGSAITVQTAVPRSITVPQLVDLSLAAARTATAGLNLTVSARNLSTKAVDTVLTQSPAAGVKVAPNSTVTVTTSSGVAVRVPSVLRQTAVLATANLRRLGFDVTSEEIFSTAAVGTVVNQEPAAGAMVEPGSTVSLTIATNKRILPQLTERVQEIGPLTRFKIQ